MTAATPRNIHRGVHPPAGKADAARALAGALRRSPGHARADRAWGGGLTTINRRKESASESLLLNSSCRSARAIGRKLINQGERPMQETLDELRQRRDLLAEIKALSENMPGEDEMEALAGYVENLRAMDILDAPSEQEMEAVAGYVGSLIALQNSHDIPDPPTDEEIER